MSTIKDFESRKKRAIRNELRNRKEKLKSDLDYTDDPETENDWDLLMVGNWNDDSRRYEEND